MPQLLTYAHTSLKHQELVWGLTTNGTDYRFILLRRGTPATYQQMPLLNLIDKDSAIQLLQILKALFEFANHLRLVMPLTFPKITTF